MDKNTVATIVERFKNEEHLENAKKRKGGLLKNRKGTQETPIA